jgi:hypothetical protein
MLDQHTTNSSRENRCDGLSSLAATVTVLWQGIIDGGKKGRREEGKSSKYQSD